MVGRSSGRRALGILTALAGLLSSGVALAARADEIAKPCAPEATACQTAPLAFSRDFGIDPIGFDTGWVPSGSPLQVHLYAQLFAETHVDLGGDLVTTWPAANHPGDLAYETIGEPGAGHLSFHYGVDIGAKAKVQITVLGQTYSWTGDIPYFPQFDYHVEASGAFDPWAFGGVSVDGSTSEQTLAQVSVTDFIGISIPGLDGGFELNSYTDLKATYKTLQMLVERPDGSTIVTGGPILAEDAATYDHGDAPLGGSVEVDVHPVGEVRYEGTLHMIPAFYIETIGPDFSIPVADIPIPFSVTQSDWVFDEVRVHVPLPDIALEGDPVDVLPGPMTLDLGDVEPEEPLGATLTVANEGEQALVASVATDDPRFSAELGLTTIGVGSVSDLAISFLATEPGDYTATLTIASNDPDEAARVIVLSAHVDPFPPAPEEDAFFTSRAYAGGGGCQCEAAGSGASGVAGGIASALAVGLVAARRRRSRRA